MLRGPKRDDNRKETHDRNVQPDREGSACPSNYTPRHQRQPWTRRQLHQISSSVQPIDARASTTSSEMDTFSGPCAVEEPRNVPHPGNCTSSARLTTSLIDKRFVGAYARTC